MKIKSLGKRRNILKAIIYLKAQISQSLTNGAPMMMNDSLRMVNVTKFRVKSQGMLNSFAS
jgi:hypothetical protein